MPKLLTLVLAASLAGCGAPPARGTLLVKRWGTQAVRTVDPDGTQVYTLPSDDTVYEIQADGSVAQGGAVSGYGAIELRGAELLVDGTVHARVDDAGRLSLPSWPGVVLTLRDDGAIVRGDGTVLARFADDGAMYGEALDSESSVFGYGGASSRRDLLLLWAGLRDARSAGGTRSRATAGDPLQLRLVDGARPLACDGEYQADGDVARGVHGLVWAADGSPAAGARVRVLLPDVLLAYTATTDASGCYLVAPVRVGAARVVVDYHGSTATLPIEIVEGRLVQVDVAAP